ncbi:hypothetical protein yc1106_01772 [Curvularia clavata]|uniref:Uncharacterized protein n=1 Tax=Curvularia clavata TaxID=95742 RepID=A0A9Q9DNX6_CURCL|nr:hypothetical protein yc1106_01772 [Curvularia clavata]
MQAAVNKTGNIMNPEMPHIPPEILQMIFHKLDFYDRNNRALCRRLFANYPEADNGEIRDDDSVIVNSEFFIGIRTTAEIVRNSDSLPKLSFRTKLDLRWDMVSGMFSDYGRDAFHPILRSLEGNMHLISKSFFTDESGEPTSWFDFETLDEVRMMIRKLEDETEQEEGSWKDMLLCVPPLSVAYIHFIHGPHEQNTEMYELRARDEGGVTLGQFADIFRKELMCMEEQIKFHRFEVQLCCIRCGEGDCYCI